MTPVDLTYTDTEDALRDSVRALLAAHCPPARVSMICDGDASLATELWQIVTSAMDLPGLGVADALGGGGAAAREVAVVMEELGRVIAPIPFLTSAVIATKVLASCGANAQLGSLVDGSRVAVLCAPWTGASGSELNVSIVASSASVEGSVRSVADAQLASILLVPATRDDILTLQAVEVNATGVNVTARQCLDMTRRACDIDLTGASAVELARGQAASDAIQAGIQHGAAMLASEQLGVAQWCLEETVAYVKQRHQFGRPIGSFQAIKHRLARLWIAVESARAAARNAAVLVDAGGPEAATSVAIAQSFCSDVAVLAAEECVQLHGGIGMTWEHSAHLYLKRAKANQVALGTPAQHRSALAQLHGL